MIFINEPNLYRLIIKSRKPEAEPFEAWVFEEVLPQIRKTGKYETQPALPTPMDTLDTSEKEAYIALLMRLLSYGYAAHELQEKLRQKGLQSLVDETCGGHYLHNFRHPLAQTLKKAEQFLAEEGDRLLLTQAYGKMLKAVSPF